MLLANEQTFIAWLEVSSGMSVLGVVAAQIHKIKDSLDRDAGHHVAGKPQAYVCHLLAIAIAFVGAYRFFRQQHALIAGRTRICD